MSDEEPSQDSQKEESKSKRADDSSSYLTRVIQAFHDDDDEQAQVEVSDEIARIAKKHKVDNYRLLFLFDDIDEITHWHANRIYRAATEDNKRDILLLIQSRGGRVEPAYLISKTCTRLSDSKFVAVVPRKAKSAATLISLGASEIHMGLMSELGPIDPQFSGFPALGMQNALSLLAELSCQYPDASEMIGHYLVKTLDLRILGYFERVSESAIQYAERLLEGKSLPKGQNPKSLADHFVKHYKDHGFVIDADEATKLLGPKVVYQNSKEYAYANEVYEMFDLLTFILERMNKQFDYVGGVKRGLTIRSKKQAD